MRAEASINEHFEHFNINEDESNVNKQVEEGRNGPLEHFFLPERDQRHDLPALRFAITAVNIFS